MFVLEDRQQDKIEQGLGILANMNMIGAIF